MLLNAISVPMHSPVATLAHHTSGTVERLQASLEPGSAGLILAGLAGLAVAGVIVVTLLAPRLVRRLAERRRARAPRLAGS